VVVVGAGPAGSSAGLTAAGSGARVLLLERRRTIGVPVRCAEYVPRQLCDRVPWSPAWVAQKTSLLRTHLPDGTTVETRAAGYVIHRELFDGGLADAARRAGAEIMLDTEAVELTKGGLMARRGGTSVEIGARVVVGADGPRSTVRGWMGQSTQRVLLAAQCRVRLRTPVEATWVVFDPLYRGGYGWLFPKGEVANVGVGVVGDGGPGPREALAHLLDKLEIAPDAIISRTGGAVPCGGPAPETRWRNVILVGDAAGQTHPITGAGVAHACLCGQMAGRAAAKAATTGDLGALDAYERGWRNYLGGVLGHAVAKRRVMEEGWDEDPGRLSALLRKTWVAFPSYGVQRPERGPMDTADDASRRT